MTLVTPSAAAALLRPGDVLCCWGAEQFADQVIVGAGDGRHYHAAMVLPAASPSNPDGLDIGEMWQGAIPGHPHGGGRRLPWSQWIAQRPDQIDVCRLPGNTCDLPAACAWFAKDLEQQDYCWAIIRRFAAQKIQLLPSSSFGPCWDENAPTPGYVCSTRVHAALKAGGYHACKLLSTQDVKPATLCRCLMAAGEFLFTVQGALKLPQARALPQAAMRPTFAIM